MCPKGRCSYGIPEPIHSESIGCCGPDWLDVGSLIDSR